MVPDARALGLHPTACPADATGQYAKLGIHRRFGRPARHATGFLVAAGQGGTYGTGGVVVVHDSIISLLAHLHARGRVRA